MGLFDIFTMIPQNMQMEEDRNQRQQWQYSQDTRAMDFNSAQALEQRDWQEKMSSTQYQRATSDMSKAGLNPMLAYHLGGSPATGGAAASTHAGSPSGGFSGGTPGGNMESTFQTASQIRVNDALEERTREEAERTRAETENIRQVTPTHAVSIEKMRQDIKESQERTRHILEQIGHTVSSAENVRQNTQNLRELVPQIRATVKNLEAMTKQTGALTGKTLEETKHIQQQIKANLPDMQRQLQTLEVASRERAVPREEQDRAAHDRFTGSLGALIRSLTGIGSYFK